MTEGGITKHAQNMGTSPGSARPGVGNLVGWVLGAFSLLYLIDELSPARLYGALERWMDAYAALVARVSDFALGWIDFRWMDISDAESHILILASVLVSAYVRAEWRTERFNGQGVISLVFMALYFFLVYVAVFVVAPAVLLPGIFGLVGAVLGVIFIMLVYFVPDSADRGYASRGMIIGELGVVLTFTALIIIANYWYFRPV